MDDYSDWAEHIAHCDAMDALTPAQRARGVAAIRLLRDLLGPNFIRDGLSEGHQLAQHLLNHAPWTRKWLAWFGQALTAAASCDGYDRLIARLRDARTASEALQLIDLGWRFAAVGFTVSYEPLLSRTHPSPDMALTHIDSRRQVFVELTALSRTVDERVGWQTQQSVSSVLMRATPRIEFAGEIHRSLSKPRQQEVARSLAEAIGQLHQVGGFISLVIPGVVTLGIALPEAAQALNDWCSSHGITPRSLSGPPMETDDERRIRRAIAQKHRQLPLGHPGIIVVQSGDAFLHHPAHTLVDEIEETVFDFANLLGVWVTSANLGSGQQKSQDIGCHVFAVQRVFDVMSKQYLLLRNRYCSLEPDGTLWSATARAITHVTPS